LKHKEDKIAKLIIEQGEQIGIRTYYNHKVVLYRKGLQLAEVHYDPENNQIDRVCSISFEDAFKVYKDSKVYLSVN